MLKIAETRPWIFHRKDSYKKQISLRIVTFSISSATALLNSILKRHLLGKVTLSFFIFFSKENGSGEEKGMEGG